MLPSLSAEHAFCPGFRHSTAVRISVERSDRISKLLTRIADMESPMMWRVEMASASSTVIRVGCPQEAGQRRAQNRLPPAAISNSAAKTAGFLAVAGILHLSATSFFRLYELRVRSEMDAPV
ncbi:hypothetical protein ACKKBF_B41145 [Auxenochlorella protothecoides x Auxenochlorella symbiontica]